MIRKILGILLVLSVSSVILILNACSFGKELNHYYTTTHAETGLPESTPTNIQSISPIITRFLPTATITKSAHVNNIALGFSYHGIVTCSFDIRDQISVFSYQDINNQLILRNSNTDYRYPVWSPNGEFIAYINAQPVVRQKSGTVHISSPGIDSIWIMKADGSDRKKNKPGFVP